MRQRKSRALWAPSAFGLPSWQSHQGTETEEPESRSHFQESWAVLRSKVTLVPFSPSPVVPPGRDLNQGISQASCPEAAEQGCTLCPTMLPPAFRTLACRGTATQALGTCHHVIPKHPKEGSTSACLGVFICLPFSLRRKHYLTIALPHSSPVSCSILPGLPCFFLLPSPCSTAVRPCLHFCLLPSFLSQIGRAHV